MANFDSKLGDWFKLVEQQEQELRAKKSVDTAVPAPTAAPPAPTAPATPERVVAEARVTEPPVASVATIPTQEAVGEVRFARIPVVPEQPHTPPASVDEEGPSLFAEKDLPPVEDFFTFMSRNRPGETAEVVEEPEVLEIPRDQASLGLAEGTGEPRPIAGEAPSAVPPVTGEPEFVMPPSRRLVEPPPVVTEAIQAPPPAPPTPVPAPVAAPVARKPVQKPAPAARPAADATQANWDRMPKHLQTLFGTPSDEVAQHSYKTFKENRGELIQRLLDPVISLEEAARVLDVCPTTVRRYTNRGVLKHLRTAGNQRRFRLSDVLAFMETGGRSAQVTEEA